MNGPGVERDVNAWILQIGDEMMILSRFADNHVSRTKIVEDTVDFHLSLALENDEDFVVVLMNMVPVSIAAFADATVIVRSMFGLLEAHAPFTEILAGDKPGENMLLAKWKVV